MTRFLAPLAIAMLIFVLPTTLLTAGARSPYTHNNLSEFDPAYVRTKDAEVGPPLLYRGNGKSTFPADVSGLESRGRVLLVARGCASCHGVDGQGAAVAPAIVPNLEMVRQNVLNGPGGMPVFSPEEVTDSDLAAIVAWVKANAKSK